MPDTSPSPSPRSRRPSPLNVATSRPFSFWPTAIRTNRAPPPASTFCGISNEDPDPLTDSVNLPSESNAAPTMRSNDSHRVTVRVLIAKLTAHGTSCTEMVAARLSDVVRVVVVSSPFDGVSSGVVVVSSTVIGVSSTDVVVSGAAEAPEMHGLVPLKFSIPHGWKPSMDDQPSYSLLKS